MTSASWGILPVGEIFTRRIVNVTFGSLGNDGSVRECRLNLGQGCPARRRENSALGGEFAQRMSLGSGSDFSALATLTTVKDWK